MEEDLKILEEFINNYKSAQEKYKDDEIQAEIERSCYFEEVPAQAIENIINRLKEDESVIEEMANEIFIEHNPHFKTDQEVIEYFRNKVKEKKE